MLIKLVTISVQNKVRIRAPKIKQENDVDDDGDENDDMDGGQDMADEIHADMGDEGSDIDEEFEFAGAGNLHEELLKQADAD